MIIYIRITITIMIKDIDELLLNDKDIIYENILKFIKFRKYEIKTLDKYDINKDYIIINTNKAAIIYIININSANMKKSDNFIKIISNTINNINKSIIVIMPNKIASNINKKILNIKDNYSIEIILYIVFINNIVEHDVCVNTKYVLLDTEEKKNFLEFYGIDAKKIHNIYCDDILATWYGFVEDDFIKIETFSHLLTGKTLIYARLKLSPNAENRLFYNNDNEYEIKDDISINEEEEEEEQDQEQDEIYQDDIDQDDNSVDYDNDIGGDDFT